LAEGRGLRSARHPHLYRSGVHRTRAYPGEHGAIIDGATWDKIQPIPAESPRHGASRTRAVKPAVLKGLIFRPVGKAMAPSHTRRRGRLYRFYLTATSLRLCHGEFPIRAVPAGEVESAVVNQIRTLLLARARRARLAGSTPRWRGHR
jgi:site-specific DNA recombinase